MLLFQHGAPDVTVQQVQFWRVWGHLFFQMKPGQFVGSQFYLIMLGTLRTEGVSWLKIVLSLSDIF